MYKRNQFALILGGLVLAVAIILQARWRYVSPPTEKNIFWLDVLQQSWVTALDPTNDIATDTATSLATVTPVESLKVIPASASRTTYSAQTTIDAVTGVQPSLIPNANGYDIGFLFGERFVVKHYDSNWQPADGDNTLVDGLKLINGQLPFTYFGRSGDEDILFYTISNETGLINLREKRFTGLATQTADVNLLTDLPSTAKVQVSLTDNGLAALILQPARSPRLITFTAQGQRIADVSLDQFTGAQALIGDNDNWLVFGQTTEGLHIEKMTNLGGLLQAVTVVLPSQTTVESANTQPALTAVARSGGNVVLLLTDRVIVLADNFTQVHGEFTFSSDQLHPQITLLENKLYFTYDTSLTLTEYQIHIALIELAQTIN